MERNLSIVMQGNWSEWSESFAERYASFPFVKSVIISSWLDQKIPYKGHQRILSKPPDNPGKGNRNLQIVSSLEGIKRVETSLCLKVRSDFFLPELEEMYKFFNHNYDHGQIYCLSLYPNYVFHIRDHMMLSSTNNLYRLFNIPLDNEIPPYNEFLDVRSESYIGMYYYRLFDNKISNFINRPNEYLKDNSPRRKESLEIYHKLIKERKAFIPFNKVNVEFPKYYPNGYPFDFLQKIYGEIYYEDLEQFDKTVN